MENINQFNNPVSPWSIAVEETYQETLGVERVPQHIYTDIHGAEIAEIQGRIYKLEESLTQVREQQIIPIQFLESEKLELKQSIVVNLSYSSEANLWIVDCPELNLYGEGKDENKAIKDFKVVLEESYLSLKRDKGKLGSELKQNWGILQQIIKEK